MVVGQGESLLNADTNPIGLLPLLLLVRGHLLVRQAHFVLSIGRSRSGKLLSPHVGSLALNELDSALLAQADCILLPVCLVFCHGCLVVRLRSGCILVTPLL